MNAKYFIKFAQKFTELDINPWKIAQIAMIDIKCQW